jgi:hypothetical protein
MLHGLGNLDLGAPLGNQHLSQPELRLAYHHQIAHAIAFALDVKASQPNRGGQDELAHHGNQLLGTFVETRHLTAFRRKVLRTSPVLTGTINDKNDPKYLRHIQFKGFEVGKMPVFLTNYFTARRPSFGALQAPLAGGNIPQVDE